MPMRRWLGCAGVVAVALLTQSPGQSQLTKTVEVQWTRYSELADLVNKQRGKVVVVDFWATFCPPCVKELPSVARMHKKYAAQGLVTITVSLDQKKSTPDVKSKVWQQLQKADARLINLILDEDFAYVQKRLRCEGPPCVFVFNRQGKWVEFSEDRFRHDLIEQAVIQFLKEK